MKNKLCYAAVSVMTVLICFSGCDVSSSTESRSDKRVIEETQRVSGSAVTTEITTTLTPLQTFERVTDIQEVTRKAESELSKKKTTAASDDWFARHKLFDMEMQYDTVLTQVSKTWYRFPEDEESTETTHTTVSVTELAEEKTAGMITRSAEDFVPCE